MTPIFIEMWIAGLLGILIYSFRKIKGLRQRTKVTFLQAFKTYWKNEIDTTIISILILGTAVYISKEYLNLNPETGTPAGVGSMVGYKIATFICTTAVVLGYAANSVADAFLGTAEAKLKKYAKDGGAAVDPIEPGGVE